MASKLVSPSVCTGKKMCTGLMVLRSIEKVHPTIAPLQFISLAPLQLFDGPSQCSSPMQLVRQVVSTTQMARLHRILRYHPQVPASSLTVSLTVLTQGNALLSLSLLIALRTQLSAGD